VALDDRAHDRQPESEPGDRAAGRVARAVETVEQMRLVLRRNADAGVGDLDARARSLAREPYCDAPTGRCELERVRQQVVEHLREPVAIADAALDGLELCHERDACLLGAAAGELDRIAHERGEVDFGWLQQQRRAVHLGREQEIADESHEPAGIALDHLEMTRVLWREGGDVVAQQQLDVAEDRRQRRAQLVRDEREEVLFGPLGLAFARDVAHHEQPADQSPAAVAHRRRVAREGAPTALQDNLVAPLAVVVHGAPDCAIAVDRRGSARIERCGMRRESGAHPAHRRVVDDHGAVAVEQRDCVRRRVEYGAHDARAFARGANRLDQLRVLLCQLVVLPFERCTAVLQRVRHLVERARELADLADSRAVADAGAQVAGREVLRRTGDVAQRCEQRAAQVEQEADRAQQRRGDSARAGDPRRPCELRPAVALGDAIGAFARGERLESRVQCAGARRFDAGPVGQGRLIAQSASERVCHGHTGAAARKGERDSPRSHAGGVAARERDARVVRRHHDLGHGAGMTVRAAQVVERREQDEEDRQVQTGEQADR